MRRRLIILLAILLLILLFTAQVVMAEDTRWSLLYRYQTDDGGWLALIVDANLFERQLCLETGKLLLAQQYHEHSKVECIPTYRLEGTNHVNAIRKQRKSNPDQNEDHH